MRSSLLSRPQPDPRRPRLSVRGLRGGRFAASRRGQVLLVAVLILFGVATLAALLLGLLGAQVVQVSRYADVNALRKIAQGGLSWANDNLLYSAAGADWRPPVTTSGQPKDLLVDGGLLRVKVSYAPAPDDVQKRYLLISATATQPDNPFSSYTISGRKTLLLTDYVRAITDRFETHQPAALGVSGVEIAGDARNKDTDPNFEPFRLSGPLFSNTDVLWYGPSQVDLATSQDWVDSAQTTTWAGLRVLRDDRIEIAGKMRTAAPIAGTDAAKSVDNALLATNPLALNVAGLAGPYTISNVFAPSATSGSPAYRFQNGFPDMTTDEIPLPNTWRVLADLLPYHPTIGDPLYPNSYSVSRMQPPRMDAIEPDLQTNRYLTLTRDSGKWRRNASKAFVNDGAWGWGWVQSGGIYVDNEQDIQYQHDLEKLRLNWVGSYRGLTEDESASADGRGKETELANWWDKTGRYYAPPGALITLHGEAACPYLEIVRYDLRSEKDAGGNPVVCAWQDQQGYPIPAADGSPIYRYGNNSTCNPDLDGSRARIQGKTAIFPFPPNGVLYAEGNVRIRGIMPPNRGTDPATAASGYFLKTGDAQGHRYRNYDLQVVSGGTIYIEGDLLTAKTAGLLPTGLNEADQVRWDVAHGSRLALLARDSVCVNTTALNPRPKNLYVRGANGEWVTTTFNDSQPLYPEDAAKFPQDMLFTNRDPLVNTTPSDAPVPTDPANIEFVYTNVRALAPAFASEFLPGALKLLLGHSGWYLTETASPQLATTPTGGPAEASVTVAIGLNGVAWPWPGGASGTPEYEFQTGPADATNSVSDHWYVETDTRQASDTTNNYLEFLLRLGDLPEPANQDFHLTGRGDTILLTPTLHPVVQGDPPAWVVKPSELGYLLGPVAVMPPRDRDPLPVRIEAMIYAQNGSWFILPGPWFNENPADWVSPADLLSDLAKYPYPIYHEPLNLRLEVVGAIAENLPAPIGDVADWTSKWSGMLRPAPATPPTEPVRRGVVYEYDPLLRQARWETARKSWCPRFPNLLLSPDLLIWGERVAGFGGAGV